MAMFDYLPPYFKVKLGLVISTLIRTLIRKAPPCKTRSLTRTLESHACPTLLARRKTNEGYLKGGIFHWEGYFKGASRKPCHGVSLHELESQKQGHRTGTFSVYSSPSLPFKEGNSPSLYTFSVRTPGTSMTGSPSVRRGGFLPSHPLPGYGTGGRPSPSFPRTGT